MENDQELVHELAIKELEKKLQDVLDLADKLRNSISALKRLQSGDVIKVSTRLIQPSIFSSTPESGNKIRIVYNAILTLNRFVKIKDIADFTFLSTEKVRSAISALLVQKRVVKIQVTTSNVDTFWGIEKWINNGDINEENMYDVSTVIGTKSVHKY